MKIERKNFTVECGDPILYVDNEARGRSGHMTHAMAEFRPGHLIDFNSKSSFNGVVSVEDSVVYRVVCGGICIHLNFPVLTVISGEESNVFAVKSKVLGDRIVNIVSSVLVFTGIKAAA